MQNARNSLCRKQWTIFMKKQWIVLINAENRFMNAVSRFEYTVIKPLNLCCLWQLI